LVSKKDFFKKKLMLPAIQRLPELKATELAG